MRPTVLLRSLLQWSCRSCSRRSFSSNISPIAVLGTKPSVNAQNGKGLDRKLNWLIGNRYLHASQAPEYGVPNTMQAWQIHEYSGSEGLTLAQERLVPSITSPKDVLIRVHAASVNPIDVQMAAGYGRNLINLYRNIVNQDIGSSEFPLTLGRDFSGVVVDVGHQVKKFGVGDEVWGAIDAKRQGTHAQFCLASEREISLKPKSLSHVESASLPFVSATTFASLVTIGGLTENIARKKRILIFAGSGGIGTFAIQLMKAWNAEVSTTCPADSIPLLQSLGVDRVFDYRSPTFAEDLKSSAGYDVILDTLGGQTNELGIPLLKHFVGAKYIDLAWDLISDTDLHGVPVGVVKTGLGLFDKVFRAGTVGGGYCWAVFLPDDKAMQTTARLVDRGLIKPVIDTVFPMEKVVEAYDRVAGRKTRGKIVVNIAGE